MKSNIFSKSLSNSTKSSPASSSKIGPITSEFDSKYVLQDFVFTTANYTAEEKKINKKFLEAVLGGKID